MLLVSADVCAVESTIVINNMKYTCGQHHEAKCMDGSTKRFTVWNPIPNTIYKALQNITSKTLPVFSPAVGYPLYEDGPSVPYHGLWIMRSDISYYWSTTSWLNEQLWIWAAVSALQQPNKWRRLSDCVNVCINAYLLCSVLDNAVQSFCR